MLTEIETWYVCEICGKRDTSREYMEKHEARPIIKVTGNLVGKMVRHIDQRFDEHPSIVIEKFINQFHEEMYRTERFLYRNDFGDGEYDFYEHSLRVVEDV